MEGDVSDVFALFGPGVIYSHNTLQNFIDFFMRIDFNNYQYEIPFITQTTKQQQNSDIDQLSDLDGGREFLLKKFSKFLTPIRISPLQILQPDPPLSNLTVKIAETFLFPSLELISESDPKCAEEAVHTLAQFFQNNQWKGDNDIPVISHKLVLLLASVIKTHFLSESSTKELIELWLSFFESRGIIDDLLIFTVSWIQHGNAPSVNVEKILKSLKETISFPEFWLSIDKVRPTQFYVGRLIDQKILDPTNVMEIIQRRAAAIHGFLYVADPRFGIVKIGSGKNGTVFTSLEQQNSDYTGKQPQSLAICHNKLLVRYKTCSDAIEILDYISLKQIGYILCDGTFSTELKEVEKKIPLGPFTALDNLIYFIDNSKLHIYEMNEDFSITLSKIVQLHAEKTPDFDTPVPSLTDYLISLVTNGHIIAVFYPQKLYNRASVSVREFVIEDGELARDLLLNNLLSNCVCFDPISSTIFDLPDYEVPTMYNCQYNIMTLYDFPYPKEMTNIPPLDILNLLPTLLSARLSKEIYSLRSKYVLIQPNYLFKTLSIALESTNSQAFISPLVKILYLHLFQFKDSELPSVELIHKLLLFKEISRKDKIMLIRALFMSVNPPMNQFEHIHTILDIIEPSMFIEATQVYDTFQLNHLVSILSANDNKFIKYAVDHFDHPSYSFIQILIISITGYVFRNECIQPSFVLPIFQTLRPVASHLFLSIMATMLPLLKKALSEPLAFASSLHVFESFLKEMHSMIPPNALKDYAISHISVSSEQPFIVKTVIDETPHPYQNNMDYVHHYDFPSAIEITVTFDQRTNSETNCDYLQIFTDRDCIKKLTDRLSGRLSRWKDKIVTTAKHLAFKFHSDGSVTEWGYKATISAKLFSRMNFTSPHPAYDVFRAFFDILLKMMKTCDASTQYIPYPNLNFDQYKPTNTKDIAKYIKEILQVSNDDKSTFEENCTRLTQKINEKYNTNLSENVELSSQQLSVINYLLKKNKPVSNAQEFIANIIDSPFIVNSYDSNSLSDHFSNLANIMLFYIPQGIPDSELDFLYKSLKGTKAAEQFVGDSLTFAENSFKSPDITLSSVCYAANKASLAFQLLQVPNYKSFLDHWFDCLRALSKIKTTPNSTLTPTSLDSILDFGCMFGDAFDDANDFVKRHLEILYETEINQPTVDIPIVVLIIRRLLLMKTNEVSNDIIVAIILRAMQFCLPYIIPFLNDIIDKFHVRLDTLDDNFMNILKGIGEGNKMVAAVEQESICFDYGVSFSSAKAECLRKMLTNISIFAEIMRKGDELIRLASLLILSCRNFQIRPCHTVYINNLNIKATVSSIDPFRYILKTENGHEYSVPAFNFTQFYPFKPQFTRILPKEFEFCGTDLTKAVISELTGPNKVFAFNALNELLPHSNANFPLLFEKLSNIPDYNEEEFTDNELVKYESMNEMLPPNQIAYVYNQPLSVYKVSMSPVQGKFGFCELGNSAPSSAILFECNEKNVTFHDHIIAENETILSIVIGYLKEGMRIFLIVNKQFKLTDFYLPPSRVLIPLVITNGKSLQFDKSPVINLPLFNSHLTTSDYSPTHIFLHDRAIAIDSICSPIQCKNGEPFSFDLFPAISSTLPFYYLEFALAPDLASISLRSPVHRAFSFYTYDLPNANPNDTYGLFINLQEQFCFITSNDTIQMDSVAELPKSDWIITFHAKTLESIFINIGQLPFMFDIDSYIEQKTSIPNKNPCKPQRTEYMMTSPLPQPYVSERFCKLSLFNNNQPKFYKSNVLRPFLINSSEKGSFYHGKIGFGRYEENQPINLIVSNDDSFTISNITFPSSNLVSLIDETAQSPEGFQQIYQRFVSTIPISFCHDLSPFDVVKTDFFFAERKKAYFEFLCQTQRYNVMNICMSRIIQQIGIKECLTKYNLEEYIVNSITKIQCDDFDPFTNIEKASYLPILDAIFQYDDQIFENLCKKALLPFRITTEDFNTYPLNMICNSIDSTINRITVNSAEAVIFIPVDTRFIDEPHIFNDNFGDLFIVSKDTLSSIFIMKHDTLLFDSFKSNELILANIIPVKFSSPLSDKLNFRFSIQFLSYLIEFTRKHPEIINKTHNYVLKPLWELYMKGSQRLFPTIQAKWLLLLFEDFVTEEMKQDIRRLIDFNMLLKDQPNILTGIACLLTLYVRCDFSNEHITQENIAHVLEFALSSNNTYTVQIFRQFTAEMLNPFRKTMPFPFSKAPFHPFLTSLAYKALSISKLPSTTKIITQNEKNELPSITVYTFEGAEKIAFVKILPLNKVSLNVNKVEVQPDCFVDGDSVTIKISRSSSDNRKFALMLIPIYPPSKPHSSDVNRLHKYQKILSESWTEDDEAMARCLIQIPLKKSSYYTFAMYPDDLYHLLFPTMDPDIARYRLCVLYLTYGKLDQSQIPNFGPQVLSSGNDTLFDILMPKHVIIEKEHTPISVHLPMKNAKLSDFFFQFCQVIDTAPINCLTSLGNSLQPPGTAESISIDTVLSQLADDMFSEGLPLIDAVSVGKLRAFQAFGCLMASLVNSGKSLPIHLRKEVIQYAFGDTSITFPELEKVRKQLNAIRSGVIKIEMICPSIRRFADPITAKTIQLLPLMTINFSESQNQQAYNFFIEDPFLLPYMRKLLCSYLVDDRVTQPIPMFVDEWRIEYNKQSNTIYLPDVDIWIQCFIRRLQH
ncbi:CUB domain containing protein [Tritrichomonas foetus]|uniref:CUB domain containing protein n=1 Tax=Tritrichomonas foetus TaxID=1144522 RepID=A0A1J4JK61_9EUKA|nr:CUB domain containing protein [Tritrichomonas foetus]|eukprot:OHS98775.1 CUB domain containing protein [Tritrichomonas foetus]